MSIAQVDPMNFDYSRVDSLVLNDMLTKDFNSPAEIADEVQSTFKLEHEKFRAIYKWIASTIAYDYDYPGVNPDSVLLLKTAVCGGYSSLLQHLCNEVGIRCEYVSGYCHSSSYTFEPLPEEPSHAWNIVTLNGIKYLTDLTWASGYFDEVENVFTREFNESYFLVKPEQFVYDHFPENSAHLLLQESVNLSDFAVYPSVEDGFRDLELANVEPSTRIVNCKVDERVFFSFSTPTKDLEHLDICIEDEEGYKEWISIAYKRENNDISFWWEFESKGTVKFTIALLEDKTETIIYKVIAE